MIVFKTTKEGMMPHPCHQGSFRQDRIVSIFLKRTDRTEMPNLRLGFLFVWFCLEKYGYSNRLTIQRRLINGHPIL